MRKQLGLAFLLLSVGCQSESKDDSRLAGEERQRPRSMTRPGPFIDRPEPEEASNAHSLRDPISVKIANGEEGSPMAPRYSPPGKRLELKRASVLEAYGVDGLETEITLGWPIDKQKPIKLLVTRPTADEAYNKLFIDANGDGVFEEDPIVAIPSESRGNTWSNFSATVKAKYLVDGPIVEDYPVAFWIAVASKEERPEFIRFSRRGFKAGEVTIDEKKATIVLSDSNNDAVFSEGDWWELRAEGAESRGLGNRNVGDFHWFGDSAFKLVLEDATGNNGRLERVDPGKTREQDELDRDPYAADRRAIKAEKPLDFRYDADEAIVEAMQKQKRCFIKFETTWCGPCKTMTQHVFTAQDVVDASKDIVCIKVDGDERKDLVERYSVKGYPTGILLSESGTETSRFVGYQKVVAMAKFFSANAKVAE